ncbi:MAG: CAP domain-containing protein [Chloroflexota bacterium]
MIVTLGQVAWVQSSPAAQQNDANAAQQILALVNEWRMQEGLWPLKPNATLEAMVLAQATYVLPKIASIPDEDESQYHTDASGQNPRQRAANPPYNWPSYGQLQQMEVGENAGVGSYKSVMNFWKTSDIHRRAALSTVYREVGVAALPYNGNYFFLMDFGARPGVLTTLTDVSGSTLYLSDERSKYTGIAPGGMQVRVFDANGRALTGTQPWTPTISFQERLSGNLFVLYSNSTYQALSPVSLGQDAAVLPGNTTVVAAPTSVPALVALPTNVPPTAAPAGIATHTPSVAAVSTATSPGTVNPDLLVLYSEHGLVLYNNTSGSINLSSISVGVDNRISVERWQSVANFSITAFPAGSCLMVSVANSSAAIPTNCKFVRSQVEVSASRVFWTTTNFTVNQGDTVLATCLGGAGHCEVDLP